MLHHYEEPIISGKLTDKGSGAIFFTGCNLKCVFCQNHSIALGDCGKTISTHRLAEIFLELQKKGAANINLVTPTHYIPQIREALIAAKENGLHLPIVYNTGSYETVESLRLLEGLVDIYLPDLKYSDTELAKDLSLAGNYFETAKAAILEMYRQTGPVVMEDEIMQRGVLLRHLVLPGYVDNSLGVIDWVSEQFPGDRILFSLMRQYTPMGNLAEPLNRKVTDEEYDACVSYIHE